MDKDAIAQPTIDIGRYWSVLVSRWAVVLGAMIFGVLIAAVYLVVVPTTYTAKTTLAVYPITTEPYAANRNSNNLVDMDAEVVTASSFKVAETAAEALGDGWDAADLRQMTSATGGVGSTTLNIAVDASSEKLARAGAAAMADAYLQTRSDQAAASIDSVVTRDRGRIEALRVQLTEAIGRLTREPSGSPAAAEASADQQLVNLQITALLSRISSLEGIDTTGGVVLNPARLTPISTKPSSVTILATGLAAGFVAGIVVAFFSHSRRKTVRGPNDLQRELEIESIGSWNNQDQAESGIESVAERILHLAEQHDARSIVLLSDAEQFGPQRLSARIAAALRASGAAVTLDGAVDEPPGEATRGRLRLVPVSSDANQATRLRALRTSDLVVLVAVRSVTRIKRVAAVQEEARSMGVEIAGVIIAPAVKKELDSIMTRSPQPDRAPQVDRSSKVKV